ncbi:thiamine pyrophosphokinase [Elusimicrobium posterum]|uniref:thiamine diphosphokinase n=1 Tax=Elusimicrobium posterum TaxID=3116653 RepID=UPI003C737357
MKNKKVLLICNGADEKKDFLQSEAENAFVICADGGANTARKAGIIPDVIIGDMDSVTAQTKKFFEKHSRIKWVKVERQDNTDLEKALDYLKDNKIKHATLVCAAGGRMDFTLGNLAVIFKYTKQMALTLKSVNWAFYPITKTAVFNCEPNQRMSLIPNTKCTGVTLSGLKYPLKNVTLETYEPQLSNETLKNKFKVNLTKGNLLVYIEKKNR